MTLSTLQLHFGYGKLFSSILPSLIGLANTTITPSIFRHGERQPFQSVPDELRGLLRVLVRCIRSSQHFMTKCTSRPFSLYHVVSCIFLPLRIANDQNISQCLAMINIGSSKCATRPYSGFSTYTNDIKLTSVHQASVTQR